MVCQAPEKYVGEELHLESLTAKERRKAAEELSGAVGEEGTLPLPDAGC